MTKVYTLSKHLLLTAVFATSLSHLAQASDLKPETESNQAACSSSAPVVTVDALIKETSDEALVALTKAQIAIQEAMREALEKKLKAGYAPLKVLNENLKEAGIEKDVAGEAFSAFFLKEIQPSLLKSYVLPYTEGQKRECVELYDFIVEYFSCKPTWSWTKLIKSSGYCRSTFETCLEKKSPSLYRYAPIAEMYANINEIKNKVEKDIKNFKAVTFGTAD